MTRIHFFLRPMTCALWQLFFFLTIVFDITLSFLNLTCLSTYLSVDGLVKCNTQMIRRTAGDSLNTSHPANRKLTNVSEGSTHVSATFHFVEGNPFTATLWAGSEGFHMTVNGRHETSFSYREVSLFSCPIWSFREL